MFPHVSITRWFFNMVVQCALVSGTGFIRFQARSKSINATMSCTSVKQPHKSNKQIKWFAKHNSCGKLRQTRYIRRAISRLLGTLVYLFKLLLSYGMNKRTEREEDWFTDKRLSNLVLAWAANQPQIEQPNRISEWSPECTVHGLNMPSPKQFSLAESHFCRRSSQS